MKDQTVRQMGRAFLAHKRERDGLAIRYTVIMKLCKRQKMGKNKKTYISARPPYCPVQYRILNHIVVLCGQTLKTNSVSAIQRVKSCLLYDNEQVT